MDNMLCFFTHTTLDFIPILLFVVDSQRTSSPHRGTGPQSVDEIYLSMAPYARVNSKSNHRAPPPLPSLGSLGGNAPGEAMQEWRGCAPP